MDALATGYGLIEGPLWRSGEGLYFSDVANGGVHRLSPTGAVTTVLPHRRGIGGMAWHATGGLVVGGRNISWKGLEGAGAAILLDPATLGVDAIGFNDLTTDAAGRVYVGSLGFSPFAGDPPKPGHLHVIDLDGSHRTVADGVMLTNGLGFSPDGRRLYHADSRADLVRVYDVDDGGGVSAWRPFVRLAGTPDGLAVATDGSVWVALAEGGCVAVVGPDGAERQRLPVPLRMVTSVCFGGDDLRDLYVVTGSRGGPQPNCGTIFRARVDVPGMLRPPARVALPRA